MCYRIQAIATCLPITFAALSLVVCTCDMLAQSRDGWSVQAWTEYFDLQKSPSNYCRAFLKHNGHSAAAEVLVPFNTMNQDGELPTL